MNSKFIPGFLFVWLMVPMFAKAQESEESVAQASHKPGKDATTLLVYARTISDSKGNFRFDQNIVPNFKIAKWLRMEIGYRHGERSGNIGAYDHYKIEFQTKSFFDRTRLIARMSDNIVRLSSPDFSRTNYLVVAETKIPVSKKIEAIANIGYVFSFQKNNVYEAVPESSGDADSHGIYKFGVKYKIKNGVLEAVFGSYDIFNPYQLSQPFCQLGFDCELWERGTMYSYYRYQYNQSFSTSFNNFLGLGVKIKLGN